MEIENIMNEETTNGLEEVYNFVYVCDKCGSKYGSDVVEKNEHVCPICEKNKKNI